MSITQRWQNNDFIFISLVHAFVFDNSIPEPIRGKIDEEELRLREQQERERRENALYQLQNKVLGIYQDMIATLAEQESKHLYGWKKELDIRTQIAVSLHVDTKLPVDVYESYKQIIQLLCFLDEDGVI